MREGWLLFLERKIGQDRTAFSPCHFHRQFAAFFGLSVHRYVQLSRIKRAAWRLAYRRDTPVIDIALDAGYEAPDAFARAFRQRIGQTPTVFRDTPDWSAWATAIKPLAEARTRIVTHDFSLDDVILRDEADIPLAVMTHRGDPDRLGDTIRRFIAWRRAHGLRPAARFLYAIWLPASGEEPRDFPLYARRVRFFPDVPEHEAITDLHLPVT